MMHSKTQSESVLSKQLFGSRAEGLVSVSPASWSSRVESNLEGRVIGGPSQKHTHCPLPLLWPLLVSCAWPLRFQWPTTRSLEAHRCEQINICSYQRHPESLMFPHGVMTYKSVIRVFWGILLKALAASWMRQHTPII